MRAIVGVTLLCFLASLGSSFTPIVFQSGSVLRYKYEGALFAGLPELANQYSGFEIKADLILQPFSANEVILHIKNVLLGKINDELPGSFQEKVDFQHSSSPEYSYALSKPIVFYHEKGVIRKFKAESSDKEWSMNIKKNILSLFSVDLAKNNKLSVPIATYVSDNYQDAPVYSVYEDGVGGDCETFYIVLSVPSLDHPDTSSDVLNVTKTKNFKNCLHRPTYNWNNYEVQGCPAACFLHKPTNHVHSYPSSFSNRHSPSNTGCPQGFEPVYHPVQSYSFTEYNISDVSQNPIIENINQEGTTSYTVSGNKYIMAVRQNVTLVQVELTSTTLPRITHPVTHESLMYTMPAPNEALDLSFQHIHQKEIVDIIRLKLESLTNDIIPDEAVNSKNAGPKILELVNAISALKHKQLQKLYSDLEGYRSKNAPRKHSVIRKIFLDILSIAPTNEVGHFILKLIKSGHLSGLESFELIEGLSASALNPDEKLLERFMKLIKTPKISSERPLFTSAIVTFGKLIKEACINPGLNPQDTKPATLKDGNINPRSARLHHGHHRIPHGINKHDKEHVHVKDHHKGKICDSEKFKKYIKFLHNEMEMAKDLREISAYIIGLAHTTSPLALHYLEPYVSGNAKIFDTLEDDDDNFVREVALTSLRQILYLHPHETLPLLVPIYFDQSESYQLRILAGHHIIRSKPPLVLLEQIAQKLWFETNNQVGSFMYSLLNELANSTVPCNRQLAQKIQDILPLAKPFNLGFQHSSYSRSEYYDDKKDYGYIFKSSWISSNETFIPRSSYFSFHQIAGPFQSKIFEVGYRAKGVKTLIKKIMEPGGILSRVISDLGSNVQTTSVQNVLSMIKEKLGTTDDDHDEMRSIFQGSLFGRNTYITLDEAFVLRILEDVIEWFKKVDTKGGISGHYVKIWMPQSLYGLVPSALGVPVVINHRQPVVFSLVVENARFAASNAKNPSPYTVSTIIRPSLHISSIVMAYGVSPAERLLYGSSNEHIYHVSLPMEINVAFDRKKATVAFSVKPKIPHEIFYHKTRPLTFQAKAVLIDVPKDEWLDNVNEIQTVPQPFKFDKTVIAEVLGMELRLAAETETAWSDIPFWLSNTAYEDGIFPALFKAFHNLGNKPREFHAYAETYPKSPASEFVVTVKYDRTLSKMPLPVANSGYSSHQTHKEGDEDSIFDSYPKDMSKIYGKKHQLANVEDTINKLMKKIHADWSPNLSHSSEDPVPVMIAHLLYVTSVVKGANGAKHIALQLMYAHTLDHRTIWFKVDGHKAGSEGYGGQPGKLCLDAAIEYPIIPNKFYLDLDSLDSTKAKLKAEIGWGRNCTGDNELVLLGVMEKSPEQVGRSGDVYYSSPSGQKALPWYYKQCQVDRREGLTQSFACQLAINERSQLNRLSLDIVSKSFSPYALNYTYKFETALKYYLYPNMEVNPLVSNPANRTRVVIDYIETVPEIPLTNVYIYKPDENIFFEKLYTPYYQPVSTLLEKDEVIMNQFMNYDYIPECSLMEDYIRTFDNVTYEIADNKCQYLLAQGGIYDNSYAILFSKVNEESKTKVLVVSAAGRTFKLMPPHSAGMPIDVDGTSHVVTVQTPIVFDFKKQHETFVYMQKTASSTDTPILILHFPKEYLTVKYDGKNANIQISHMYKGNQKGLCGNFNGEYYYEFQGPDECLYVEREDFVNSYAIPDQSCPASAIPDGPAFCPDGRTRTPVQSQPVRTYDGNSDNSDNNDSSKHM